MRHTCFSTFVALPIYLQAGHHVKRRSVEREIWTDTAAALPAIVYV